jgi:hypothetical protein
MKDRINHRHVEAQPAIAPQPPLRTPASPSIAPALSAQATAAASLMGDAPAAQP